MSKYVQTQTEWSFVNVSLYPKIAELGKAGEIKLIDILAKWRYMAGITMSNQSEEEAAHELLIIKDFVVKNYCDKLNLEEIQNAIDFSLTEKLDVDIRSFNVFSPMYVSRILNAYIKEKNNVFYSLHTRYEADNSVYAISSKPSPEQMAADMVEIITKSYQSFKDKATIFDGFGLIYNYFKRKNKLNLSKEMIAEAVKYGEKMAAEEKQSKGFFDVKRLTQDSFEELKKSYSRNYVLQKLYERFDLEYLTSDIKPSDFDGNNG